MSDFYHVNDFTFVFMYDLIKFNSIQYYRFSIRLVHKLTRWQWLVHSLVATYVMTE